MAKTIAEGALSYYPGNATVSNISPSVDLKSQTNQMFAMWSSSLFGHGAGPKAYLVEVQPAEMSIICARPDFRATRPQTTRLFFWKTDTFLAIR